MFRVLVMVLILALGAAVGLSPSGPTLFAFIIVVHVVVMKLVMDMVIRREGIIAAAHYLRKKRG